jgi:hypothetical protein
MRPALPKPARSIIERQHVVLSRCVSAIGLPDNGILPELDDRQISRFAYRSLVPQFKEKVTCRRRGVFGFQCSVFREGNRGQGPRDDRGD